jgi:hypothetical protein
MCAAVAYRTREIGTLRAFSFSRSRIILGVPGRVGGAGGDRRRNRCLLALPVHGLSTAPR